MYLYAVLFTVVACAASAGVQPPQMAAVPMKLPHPMVTRILILLMRDYNSRTSPTAPIWGAYEIVYAIELDGQIKIVFRMAETICKKHIVNRPRCPLLEPGRKVQCKIWVGDRVRAKDMMCKKYDADLAKQSTYITYKYNHFEVTRWWWRRVEKRNITYSESSARDESQIRDVKIDLEAVAKLAALTLNKQQSISKRLVNYFGKTKIVCEPDGYEAIVYIAETECTKPTDVRKIRAEVDCAFIYPGKSYECFVSLSKPKLLFQGPVRCGPTDKVPQNRLYRAPLQERSTQ